MAVNIDDLDEIQDKIWDARPKWKNIGLALKIRKPDIDVIDKNKGDIDEIFQDMIVRWLENGENCTWAALSEALSARSVGHKDLAEKVRREKCVDDDNIISGAQGKPQRDLRNVTVDEGTPKVLQSQAACPTPPLDPTNCAAYERASETKHLVGTENTTPTNQQQPVASKKATLFALEGPYNQEGGQYSLADSGLQGNKGHETGTQAAIASVTLTMHGQSCKTPT